MAKISTQSTETEKGWDVDVVIEEGGSQTQHTVVVPRKDYEKITDSKVTVDKLVEASIEFLLNREPKEAILAKFELLTIARYFPSYMEKIKGKL